ncbi:hypothetical protein [Vibrio sp. HN007]|uniref:hypothetical protein n=1 Tax=Vibrio iocasae TaxID=3098914 RepID=UPI0035D3E798
MPKKKELPKSFTETNSNLQWARNYLKKKVEAPDVDIPITALIDSYSLNELSYSELIELISELNDYGDTGLRFIGTMSDTWRAKYARQNKKFYNLSLDKTTQDKLKQLAKKSARPNASIKQALIDLIDETYKTKLETKKSRPKLDHDFSALSNRNDSKYIELKEKVESLEKDFNERINTLSNSAESNEENTEVLGRIPTVEEKLIQLQKEHAEQELHLKSLQRENRNLMQELSKEAKENSELQQRIRQLESNEDNKVDGQPQTKETMSEQNSHGVQGADTEPNLEGSNRNVIQHGIPVKYYTVNKEN